MRIQRRNLASFAEAPGLWSCSRSLLAARMFTARRSRNQNLSRELREWAARNYCNVGNSVRPIRVIRAIRGKKIFAKIQETRH